MAKTKKTKILSPLRIGASVLIRTVTLYHVGKIELLTKDEIVLSGASWVFDTGRFSVALQTGTLAEVEPFVGPVSVSRGGVIDVTEWIHPLPTAAK